MKPKIKYVLSVLLVAPVYLLLYTAIHEGGHALIALIYGGKIESFVLGFNAHVSHHGTSFTVFGSALHDAAGMLLPTILGIIALCFYSDKSKSISYYICYLLGSVSLPGSILPWVGIPIISMFALPPQGDDVTKFLNVTGFYPLLVSLSAILLIGLFVFLAYKKGIYRKTKEMFAVFKGDTKLNHKQVFIGVIVGLLLLFGGFNLLNIVSTQSILSMSFTMENTLEEKSWKCNFDVENTKNYSIDTSLKAHGFITALRIIKDNGELAYQNLGEEFSFTSVVKLSKGNYTLSLTYLPDYEAVEQFFKSTGQQIEVNANDMACFDEAFSHDNNDYSAVFSIKIR